MDKKYVISNLVKYPDYYMDSQSKSLESRIEEIKLTDNEQKKIVIESNQKLVKEAGIEVAKTVIPPISLALEFMGWNKTVDEDLKEAKKSLLFTKYFDKVDSQEKAIKDLKETMTNVYGNTLVNKIFQMLDDFPPDADLMKHLVSSLKKICETKQFEELFDDHKFYLGLIDKLSPQALSFIADVSNWPMFTFNFTGMSIGNQITDTFQEPFIEAYLLKKKISDVTVKQRGVFIVNELQQDGFIKCYGGQNQKYQVVLTELGKGLYEYLN